MAGAQGIRAGRAYVELGVDDKIAKGLRAAQRRLKAFGEGLRAIGTRMFAIGAAVLTPMMGAAKAFADSGDALEKMSRRTGVSVEALSELGFAAEQSGADLETLETGLRKMQKTIVEAAAGSDGAVEALARLQLTVADLANLSPEQQFKLIADRLSQIKDPALRAALAIELFGRTGTRLLPLMQDGARGIEQLQEEARTLGLTLSTDAAQKATALRDTLHILWRVLKKLTTEIGAALADAVIDLAGRITRVVVTVTAWIRQNQAIIVSVAKVAAGVMAAGAALVAVGALVSGLGAIFGVLASVVSGVGTVFGVLASMLGALLSPIGLVVAAIAGLGAAILVYTGAGADALAWLGDTFRWLKNGVLKVVGGIADALAAGDIGLAARILWLSLKLAWQEGISVLNRAWLSAKNFFVKTAYDMWYGALFAAETVWHGLEVAWIETTAFLSKTWDRFVGWVWKAWDWCAMQLAKLWNWLKGIFDETFDVKAANRAAEAHYRTVKAQIEEFTGRKIAEREERRRREREEAAAEHEATIAVIGEKWTEAERKIDEQTAEAVAATREALEKARAELNEALARARQKREEAEAAAPPRRRFDLSADLEDQLAGLGELLARKITISGTFNPLAVAGLGGDAVERTARNTEQIAKHTKRLADAAAVGRLSFA